VYGTSVPSAGDKFTALTGLFTALAFAALIYATWLQRRELALQRQELSLTREELAGQRRQMESQNATLTAQRFENTFFQLLGVHQDIIGALRDHQSANPNSGQKAREWVGRECFVRWYDNLSTRYELSDPRLVSNVGTQERATDAYRLLYSDEEAQMGHYFRNLYHIVRFVDESDIVDKQRYARFVRAQLSSRELILLFYNCLSEFGREKFKPLIEKYALLKNMPFELLLHSNDRELYDRSAYGKY